MVKEVSDWNQPKGCVASILEGNVRTPLRDRRNLHLSLTMGPFESVSETLTSEQSNMFRPSHCPSEPFVHTFSKLQTCDVRNQNEDTTPVLSVSSSRARL